jgi:hypothetical protein
MKKYALLYWSSKEQKLVKLKSPKYVTEEEFIKDDWEEKAFDLDKDDFIEEENEKI